MQNYIAMLSADNLPLSFLSVQPEKSLLTPKIAVLLAAFNGSQWIEQQLKSILDQEDIHIHLFVSIDFSTDNTYEIVKNIQNSESRINILPYGNVFGGAAKNFYRLISEVDFSTFDFVAFADQDDIWLPNKLSRAVYEIKSKSLSGYSSNVLAFWGDGHTILVNKSHTQRRYDFLFESAGPGCTYVFRTDALASFKQFLVSNWDSSTDIFLHDWLIYAFFRSSDFNWFIDSRPSLLYRQHSANQVGVNSGVTAFFRRIRLLRSGWYRCEIGKIAKLLGLNVPNRWFILRNFFECRRRSRDAIALFFFVLFNFY